MSRVFFDNQPVAPQPNTGRADVACFVGLARRVQAGDGSFSSLSAGLSKWLSALGYPVYAQASLTDVPIPVESYAGFAALFDDASSGTGSGTDYLAAAVRSFFAQGGKKTYIVRTGDPMTPENNSHDRAHALTGLLLSPYYSVSDADTWTGIGALGVLEDVSFVLLPDLPALCASEAAGAIGQAPVIPTGPQTFAECSPAEIVRRQQRTFSSPAPRLNTGAYSVWAGAVGSVIDFLSSGLLRHQLHLREMQFVAAMPLHEDLDPATAAERDPSLRSSTELAVDIHEVLDAQLPETVFPGRNKLSSAFLQLAYPWLRTSGSSVLLESLEPADGALAGLLARNALTRGAFTSAVKIIPSEIYDVFPDLPMQELRSPELPVRWGIGAFRPLIERLSLFGFTPAGLRLLSDVTTYPGESYRPAPVNRLVAVLGRAARRTGDTSAFRPNGPALWGSVQRALNTLLTRLWNLGALDGATIDQAFSVRCDRTTMTQNDLDNGRLIANVTFTPAALLETLRITLAIESTGTSVQEIAGNQIANASSENAGFAGVQ